uniref:LOW QUALITY PROTEIN: kunitz/BPTI-like toxin n=1 Tax=Euleptes europaea TaxID=460621 RepID=UPI002541766B|nr:LOW QUALITY PROTEIN: kunitz/BPTI-like toxin [Euleptes europaea]
MQLGFHLLLLGLMAFRAELTLVSAQKRPDFCYLPKKVGPCKAFTPRFFYNSHTQNCERFFYGGCQGNVNNFETLEKCQHTCENPAGVRITMTVMQSQTPLNWHEHVPVIWTQCWGLKGCGVDQTPS